MRLTVVNSYSDKRLKEAVEEGHWSGSCRGSLAPSPYDMYAQEGLCLAWMHGQWMGSLGRDRGTAWEVFKKTDGYRRPPCAVTYDISDLDIEM